MKRFILCLLLFLTTFAQDVLASVLAIDYGAEWIKASLMSPGVPFDVLLDRNSKRKIQSTVGWKREDRLFGSDAFNIAGRFPTDSFSSLKFLQAAPFDSQAASFYTSISTADIVKTERGTVALRRSDGTEWTVEELIAMQLGYVRDLAESAANEKVKNAIITVPPYYTEHERNAVIDAAEIAGLSIMALIHDGTAVAVNYAMTRTFNEKPEYHVIYDAGASSIRATIVGFNSIPGKTKKDTATSITVKGLGYDRTVGGAELDRRLRDILINDFNKKHKKEIRDDKRGMAKLWKEASRVKAILSANAEAMTSVESLAWDIDFRSKVSRNEFENACKDLKVRYAKPILDALASADLSLDNITSVILTGGASRTPMIQSAVRAAVGESKIAMNVNADEAAVLGAALYGAGISRQFKTKDIRITDMAPYDILVAHPAPAKADGAQPRTLNALIFSTASPYPKKKTLTLKNKEDLTLQLHYRSPPAPGFPTDIIDVQIKGVSEALQNLTEAGAIDPLVKATIQLSESGFVSVHEVVAYGEIKDESISGKIKSLFGAGSSASVTESEDKPSARSEGAEASTTATGAANASETKEAEKKAVVKDTIELKIETTFPTLPPLSVQARRVSRERLRAISNAENAKQQKEEALNTLEGYLYRVRDLLEEESDTPFRKCSKAQERSAMREKLDETLAWLHDQGENASTNEYVSHRTALENLEYPITHRYTEVKEFPVALNNSQKWNWSTRLFLTEAKLNLEKEVETGEVGKYTKEELDALEKTLKEHEVWLNDVVEKQKRVQMYDDPAVESKELYSRAKVLETHLQKLVKKKAPKKKSATTSSSKTESTTASESRTESTATPTPRHEEL